MKRRFAYTLGAVALVLLTTTAALAIDAPHNYNCTVCHVTHRTLGLNNTVNICLACHASPSVTTHNFKPMDQANPFGTASLGSYTSSTKGRQTSHNWNAPDISPAAGATPPATLAMNTPSSITKTVTCARCHSIHVGYADYTGTNPKRSKPLLRMRNDQDQMCVDCHSSRNQTSHTGGTHPVNVTYATVASSKPADYNAAPVNSNPANPTSAMKLNNGKILCSTCHGVHFSDSHSATLDNMSSAVQGKLSSSKGYLLRTDLRGATPAAANICTNCHAGKLAHNGGGQNVQCADCHAGHVDVGDGTKANVFLVRRYMNISTAAGAVRNRMVMYTSVTSKNYTSPTNGVCNACHTIPAPGGTYPPEHASSSATVCQSCHSHNGTIGSFSGGCTTCHGYPPPVAAAGYTGPAETASSLHQLHAGGASNYSYSCIECHKGNNHNSAVKSYQDVFLSKTGIIAATAGAVPAYATGTRTCSALYCHSDGAPRNAALVPVLTTKTVPAWGSGSTLNCDGCHASFPVTNSHGRHYLVGFMDCRNCHNATLLDPTTFKNKALHVDGTKTVEFSPTTLGGKLSGGSYTIASATCSAVYCHSDGRGGAGVAVPIWTDLSTGKCGKCHYTTPTIAATSAQTIATFGHDTHLSFAYGPGAYLGAAVSACQTCHTTYVSETDASHVNGTIEKATAAGSNCAKCHPGSIPDWTVATRLDCSTCHGATPATLPNAVVAPSKQFNSTYGHGQAGANYNASRLCTNCHDQNSAHISGVLGDTDRLLLANNNALCSSCHNDAAKVPTVGKRDMATHVTVKGDGGTMDCKACHDVHGTGNLSMIKATINGQTITFLNTSSGFVNTVTNQGLCQACHTLTNHFKAGVAETGHPKKNCLSCHDHKASFAFKASGTCDSCHGYPPVASMAGIGTQGIYSSAKPQDYTNGGGAHAKAGHIKPSASPTEGWENCKACHSGGSLTPTTHVMSPVPATQSNITISIDPAYKFNNTLPTTYSGPLNGSNTTGSCSNVSCHFKPTPVWAP